MPSLADIPPEYHSAEQSDAFFLWLKNLPLDYDTKKELLYIWQHLTDFPITSDIVQSTCGAEP